MRQIMVGFQCNNLCVFCAQGDLRRSAPQPTDADVRARIAEAIAGAAEIAFVGGEPTLRDELPDWLAAAKAAGARWTLVQTNGRRLAYPSYTPALKDAGADAVEISLAGSSAAMHDYHTSVAGSFHQTLLGIRRARAAGLAVGVGVVVTRSNFRHLLEVVKIAIAQGAQAVRLAPAVAYGRAGADWLRVVPDAQMIRTFLIEAMSEASALGRHDDPRLFAGLGPIDASTQGAHQERARQKNANWRSAPAIKEVHVKDKKTGESLREIFPDLFAQDNHG